VINLFNKKEKKKGTKAKVGKKDKKKKKGKKTSKKVKMALYWGATCGGCDVAVLDLNEKILDVAALADILLWPVAMDFKYKHVRALDDNEIDVTLYNGGIVNTENEKIAKLLRQKSKVMIAFGSCSCFGGIPGLCNVASRDEIFRVVYKDSASTVNPDVVTPQLKTVMDGHTYTLPEKYDTAKTLDQVVDVDYYVPGCPPAVELIEKAVGVIAEFAKTGDLPPKGTVIASEKSVCDECGLRKENKMIGGIKRPYEIVPEPDRCLLEQGIICMGPATRGGCGTRCINVRMPCRGCMGPLPGVLDQGAKMISAISAILGVEGETEADMEAMAKLVKQIKDPLGTFYRFTLPAAMLNKAQDEKGGG
jgi:F420-non-reducing hydrogenase small subunit